MSSCHHRHHISTQKTPNENPAIFIMGLFTPVLIWKRGCSTNASGKRRKKPRRWKWREMNDGAWWKRLMGDRAQKVGRLKNELIKLLLSMLSLLQVHVCVSMYVKHWISIVNNVEARGFTGSFYVLISFLFLINTHLRPFYFSLICIPVWYLDTVCNCIIICSCKSIHFNIIV